MLRNPAVKLLFFLFSISLWSLASCSMYNEMQVMKKPRYEVGEQRGAKFCAECHDEIYQEWVGNSRHAQATTAQSFRDFRDMFTDVLMYDVMMGGEEMCYGCHGIKEVDDGVNCETCHGLLIQADSVEESIEITHEKKYTPGREKMGTPDFCLKCHSMVNPMSGVPLMGLKDSYQKSEAAAQGIVCQSCHMKPREDDRRYHGFDTAVRDVTIYRGDLSVKNVKLEFPTLSLSIENHVTGHSIPAGGGTRTLGLKVLFMDAAGTLLHREIQTFAKRFSQMPVFGLMPYKLIEDTQLQSGETRKLSFTLPDTLKDKISEVLIVMRFYEVSDEHEGDISKAHWTSEPFFEESVKF